MMKNRISRIIFLPLFLLAFLLSCSGHKIDSQLLRVEELKGTRKFDEALEIYKLIINDYPNDKKTATAYFRMGDLYLYTFNDSDSALSAYTKIIDKWPFAEDAAGAAIRRAEIFKGRGNSKGAVAEYEWVLKHFPDYDGRFDVMLNIAKEYLALNDPYQAAIELESLLGNEDIKDEIRSRAFFDLGESYLFLEEYEKAFRSFQALVKGFPEAPYILDARIRMVECLEKTGRTDEAIALWKDVVRLHPDSELVKKKNEGLIRREEKTRKPDVGDTSLRDMEIRHGQNVVAKLKVEIADTPDKQVKGLMYRKELGVGRGMWFIFDSDVANPFWMENTLVSLDIIFVNNDKEIISIARNTTPLSRDPIKSRKPYRYVLEVPAGFAKQYDLEKGDKIELK